MNATVEAPQSWQRSVKVEVPREDVTKAFDGKVSEYAKKIRLDGFRKGKVPSKIVKSRYGKQIEAEVLEEVVQNSFEQACRDNNIMPVSRPSIEDIKNEESEPLHFTAQFEVDPTVEVTGYDKLKVKKKPEKVTKKEIDEAIENVRNRFANYEDVERPSQKGDMVTLVYEKVVVDGEEKSDVSSPQYPIELGASKIKDFDDGLIGHSAGETVHLSITFPENYDDKELAGKQAEMDVTLSKIQQRHLPELNEEFVSKLGDFKDEGQLREFVEKDLARQHEERAKNEAHEKAIDELIEKNNIEVAPSRTENYLARLYEEQNKRAQQQNAELPEYDQFKEQYKDHAQRMLKRQAIIDYVAKQEKIKPTQQEVDTEIQKVADQYHQPFDEVKKAFRKNGTTNRIREDLKEMKTLDYLIGEYDPQAEKEARDNKTE